MFPYTRCFILASVLIIQASTAAKRFRHLHITSRTSNITSRHVKSHHIRKCTAGLPGGTAGTPRQTPPPSAPRWCPPNRDTKLLPATSSTHIFDRRHMSHMGAEYPTNENDGHYVITTHFEPALVKLQGILWRGKQYLPRDKQILPATSSQCSMNPASCDVFIITSATGPTSTNMKPPSIVPGVFVLVQLLYSNGSPPARRMGYSPITASPRTSLFFPGVTAATTNHRPISVYHRINCQYGWRIPMWNTDDLSATVA